MISWSTVFKLNPISGVSANGGYISTDWRPGNGRNSVGREQWFRGVWPKVNQAPEEAHMEFAQQIQAKSDQ